MKWLTVITIILLSNIIAAKSVTKPSSKKASSVKPTKTPKSIIDQFTELPADDLAFIKELDKQFKLHGNSIKFKIVKDNSTKPSKNNKRTIDGELGYGYQQNYYQGGYQFLQPRFEFNPHSGQYFHGQQFNHQQQYPNQVFIKPRERLHTTVEIIPSRSYEIKETPHGYSTVLPGHGDQFYQQQEQDSPVIVLKIPGPSKYAAHLQALLQQYLEIRAHEVIQALQEEELRHQQQAALEHQQRLYQQHQQIQQLHLAHIPTSTYAPEVYQAPQYLPNHSAEQQIYQQQGSYEVSSPNSYESQAQIEHVPSYSQEQSQEQQDIIYHQAQQQQQQHVPQYHQEEDIVYHDINVQQTPRPHEEYGIPNSHENGDGHDLPIVENYPDGKHTRVLLPPKSTIKPDPQYADDSIAVKDKYPPPAPTYEDSQEQQEADYQYTAADHEEEVAITQRPPSYNPYATRAPYNYHAHGAAHEGGHGPVYNGNAKRNVDSPNQGKLRKKTRRVLRRTKKTEVEAHKDEKAEA